MMPVQLDFGNGVHSTGAVTQSVHDHFCILNTSDNPGEAYLILPFYRMLECGPAGVSEAISLFRNSKHRGMGSVLQVVELN